MKLNESQIAKIDPLLEDALIHAREDEEMLVIMSLDLQKPLAKDPFKPQDFPEYKEYRQALLNYRQQEYAASLGETIQALEKLDLKIAAGGTSSRVLVVQGSSKQIAEALELSGVRHASLDRLIALPKIATDESINYLANLYIKVFNPPLKFKILFCLINTPKKKSIFQRPEQYINYYKALFPRTKIQKKELVFQAAEQYIINYYKRHNKLQVLGMQQPVELDNIYTAVQFLSPEQVWQLVDIKDLEEIYRQTGKRGLQYRNTDKKEGIKVAKKEQYLMVLGAPGAGKSTFLRKIGLEALRNRSYQHKIIPVFIELKQFTSPEINLEQVINRSFQEVQFPASADFTTKALQQGKLLILLDGLDEIPSKNLDLAVEQIQAFVKQHQKNRFIVSCRTAAYNSTFPNFYPVLIADFDDSQIQQFINNWFATELDKQATTASQCWELINSPEYLATKEICRTPLLLTFICLVYEAEQYLPKNRATLYGEALDILLKKWAGEKKINKNTIARDLGSDLEKVILTEIAYRSFVENRLFFTRTEIIEKIQQFLTNNANAPKNLAAEVVLDAMAIEQGILVERARNAFSFSHLTLQEYLTAQYIYDHDQIEQLAREYLTNKRWKEVFLLVAGLIRSGAEKLLLQMDKQVQKLIISPKLIALLNWAEQVTAGSEGNFKPVAKRAIANVIANANAIANTNTIAIDTDYTSNLVKVNDKAIANAKASTNANTHPIAIANTYAIAIASTYAIDIDISNAYAINTSIAIAYIIDYTIANFNVYFADNVKDIRQYINKAIKFYATIDELKIFGDINRSVIANLKVLKSEILDEDQPNNISKQFANKLLQTYLQSFHLNREMVTLSEEEIKGWDNYLYANLLIIQCKQAAVQVSPQVWAAIEDRMLLPPKPKNPLAALIQRWQK
jgi:hypothetical protein